MGSHVKALQAWVRDLENVAIIKEWYMQEEIARVLTRERERWQWEWESYAVAMERERSQHIAEMGFLQGYIGVLVDKMRG